MKTVSLKYIPLLAALALAASMSACTPREEASNGKLKVVATIGMIADVAQNIGGDLIEVKGLMGPGVDPHLYKATPSDIEALRSADVIFYGGLHLESKMGELFEEMAKSRTVVPVTGSIPEDQLLSPAAFSGLHDPHVWFDVSLWRYAAQEIAKTLSESLPDMTAAIDGRAQAYIAELDKLDTYVAAQTQKIDPQQRVLITAHDAFNYFGKRYGFEVVGLQGISTEAEAGTGDVQRLVDFIVSRKIQALFIESSVPVKNIQAVQEAVKAKGWDVAIGGELYSDAMGSAGTFEGTYIGMVTHNIDTIVAALGDIDE